MTSAGDYVLYRYFDARQRVLYIGKSGNAPVRESAHIRRSQWMQFAAGSAFERFGTPEELAEAERRAIETEFPLFNTQYNYSTEAAERLRAYLEEVGRTDLMPARLGTIAGGADVQAILAAADEWNQSYAEHLAERDHLVRISKALGLTVSKIASDMGISRTTVYAILDAGSDGGRSRKTEQQTVTEEQ